MRPIIACSLILIVSRLMQAQETVHHALPGPYLAATFGVSVTGAGDLDQDGFDDFAVGARLADNNGANSGTVLIYSGCDGSVLFRIHGPGAGDELGISVSGGVDMTGDGVPDVLCGARYDDDFGNDSGSAWVVCGAHIAANPGGTLVLSPSAQGVDAVHYGDAAGDILGAKVVAAPDVDGDGVGDVVLSASGSDSNGQDSGLVKVLSGTTGATIMTVSGDAAGDRLSALGAGDIDGDGRAEVLVSSTSSSANGPDSGLVRIVDGATGGTVAAVAGPASGVRFGVSGAVVGDVDGDGLGDVVVSTFLDDVGGTDTGSAWILSGAALVALAGGTTNLPTTPSRLVLHRFHGEHPGDWLGYRVGAAGDVNGDGVPDVVCGVRLDDEEAPDGGSTVVFSGLDGSEIFTATGATAGDQFGRDVAPAGDVNGDGRDDVIAGAFSEGPNQIGFAKVLGVVPAYQGTGEDLVLTSALDSDVPSFLPDVKRPDPGQLVGLHLASSDGTFVGFPYVLAAELFPTGSLPTPAFTGLHFSLSAVAVVDGLTPTPFVPALPPSGVSFGFLVPPGLAGQSAIFQGVVLTYGPPSTNALFASSPAHEIRF